MDQVRNTSLVLTSEMGRILHISHADDFLMVIGGSNSTDKLGSVELISLDPANNPVPECLHNLASLPYKLNGAAAGITSGK